LNKFIIIPFIIFMMAQSIWAQIRMDREDIDCFIGKKRYYFIPFNAPMYSGYLADKNNNVSLLWPGFASLPGHLEYNHRIYKDFKLGLGIGYPYILFTLEKNIVKLRARNLIFRFKYGTHSIKLFYELKTSQEIFVSEKTRLGLSVAYLDYAGFMDEIFLSTYPTTEVVTFSIDGIYEMERPLRLTYSFGFSVAESSYTDFVDTPFGRGSYNTFRKQHTGWNAAVGYVIIF